MEGHTLPHWPLTPLTRRALRNSSVVLRELPLWFVARGWSWLLRYFLGEIFRCMAFPVAPEREEIWTCDVNLSHLPHPWTNKGACSIDGCWLCQAGTELFTPKEHLEMELVWLAWSNAYLNGEVIHLGNWIDLLGNLTKVDSHSLPELFLMQHIG